MAASRKKMYSPLSNNEMYSEILKNDSVFTFVDFLPKVINPSGNWTTRFEKFRVLVERANDFLQSNPKWKIVNCETFQYQAYEKDHSKMTYEDVGVYTRCLRLWLAEREDHEMEQKIGYLYLVPQKIKKETPSEDAEFETLDTVIRRFNSLQWYNPIPGRIITVESLKMDTEIWRGFDPDRTIFTNLHQNHFVIVIKIFYEVMDCSPEEVGLKDFIPRRISEEDLFAIPKYERFSSVLNKASIWWSQQQNLRFCNATSLVLKEEYTKEANTQKMSSREYKNGIPYYVRILRIAYIKTIHSTSEKQSPITNFTCRTFVPMQLSAGLFSADYETIWATKERIVAWVKATGVHVVGAETTSYPKRSYRGKNEGSEDTFIINGFDHFSWMIVIRLYISGFYSEPPLQMLPPMPVIEKNSCHIS